VRRARVCGANLIFTLHEAAVIAARRNVMERDIAWHRAKERNAFSDQHRYARDYQSVDQSRRQEPLNREAAVYVGVLEAACFEPRYNFARLTLHLFDYSVVGRRKVEPPAAQHDHRLLAVECQVSEFQHDIEGPAADHHYIDTGEELLEPVRLLLV